MNRSVVLLLLFIAAGATASQAAEPTAVAASDRQAQAQLFHLRAQQRSGVLVPMYVYPADIHTNTQYNRLIELKRRYETVPFWVIINANSGPGSGVDPNYTKAIDRLRGAGCVVLAYVSTRYGQQTADQVATDMDAWLKFYPQVQGVFFDEMLYEDTDKAVAHQVALNQLARTRGLWPTVANPGAETPGRYFAADAADVIVVHEGNDWPEESRMKGDYFGGYSDYPPFTRGILLHSSKALDKKQLTTARHYARWFYVTPSPFNPKKPAELNPWDNLSPLLEELCKELAK